MSNMSKITFYFKDIFPDLDTFKAQMAVYSEMTPTDAIHASLYKRLYNRYCNSNVAYMTEDAFMRHFFNYYDDTCDQYKKRLELVGYSYNVTAADIEMLGQTLNAIANNDDTALTNPLDSLASYVSMQQGSKTKGNKLEAYINAIDKIKDRLILDFLKQFTSLFFFIGIDGEIY